MTKILHEGTNFEEIWNNEGYHYRTQVPSLVIFCGQDYCRGFPSENSDEITKYGMCFQCHRKNEIRKQCNENCRLCDNGTRWQPMVRKDGTCQYCDRYLGQVFRDTIAKYKREKEIKENEEILKNKIDYLSLI